MCNTAFFLNKNKFSLCTDVPTPSGNRLKQIALNLFDVYINVVELSESNQM